MESEFVSVSRAFKGHVIGKGGYVINDMIQRSGARIIPASIPEEGFTVRGDAEQVACAKTLILQKVAEIKHGIWEPVEIPTEYIGLIIGKHGANLREIYNQTGAEVTREGQELYIVSGTEQQREQAKLNIGLRVAGGRFRGVENEFKNVCCFIDEWNLPKNCELKLEKVQQYDRNVLPGTHVHGQYRLIPAEEYETQECSNNDSSYLFDLTRAALESLHIKREAREGNEYFEADMWCHFGTAIIRGPNEEEADKGKWNIGEAIEKFQSSAEGNYWKVAFKEGVDIIEDIFKGIYFEKTPGEYLEYMATYDLTFFTPCGYLIRCKVWVAKENAKKKLEDIPILFSDVKNILDEIHFKDGLTRSRCRGWLVFQSRTYLQADILFPGCEFDCRLTIRGRADSAVAIDYIPGEDERRVLCQYLSELTLTEDDAFGLRLPEKEMPEGFHLIHKRSSKRTVYTTKPGFSIILTKESSWRSVPAEEKSRETTDVLLHCEEWDKLLGSGHWEPKIILGKLPEFFQFVKDIQGLVIREMKRNGLKRNIPPEILARGPLALEAYNNALAEGKSCVKRVPLMLIGQDRSGKTSLKKSLKGICFNPEEDSTVGIDVDHCHFKVTTEIWMTGKKDEESKSDAAAISFEHNAARLVADTLRKEESVTEDKRVDVASARSFDSEITDLLMETQLNELVRGTGPIETHTDIIHEPDDHVPAGEMPDTTTLSPEDDAFIATKAQGTEFEDVAAITEKLLQDDRVEKTEDIYSMLWDFAGQSVYYETHPLFLTARAMYFLVYDLSQNPHDRAKPLVKQGVYKKFIDSFNLKTNLNYLDFWMTSVASLASQDERNVVESEAEVNKLPPVVLVCTHADKPHDGRDPWEVAKEMFGYLKNKPHGALLSDVFVVDNTKSGSESECREVVRLRKVVLDVAKELPHINDDIPIKWLKYEKALQIMKKEGHRWISLHLARHIASEVCNINIDKDNEISTLLNFLHDMRILIHFDDTRELNDVVVLDPQWLIDVFKKVITVKPYHWKEKHFIDLWLKLEREGILEEELLEHVWDPLIHHKETSQSFIAIMEKFSLLCPWPLSDASCSKQYLVPSMLKSHPPEDTIMKLVASAQIPSLFVRFESGHVPPGLFPRLVLQFFQWGKEQFWRPGNPTLYHSFVRFHISGDEDCSVILRCHLSSIEVVYHRGNLNDELSQPKMTLSTDFSCSDVRFTCTRALRSQLGLMLECMRNQFCWLNNMQYKLSVICPVCCQGNALEYCDTHHEQGCKEEECLHFWSETVLCGATPNIVCTHSASAQNCRVNAKYWAPWFASPDEQLTLGLQDGRPMSSSKDKEENSLALPGTVRESLLSQSSSSKEIVRQLEVSLPPDRASLKEPVPETKALIRYLAREAKGSDRLDVVKHLRDITPAGTVGPLLSESLDVRKIPFEQGRKLTISLSGKDVWKLVAEKLGLTSDEICFLDIRTQNPAEAMLRHIANRYNITVGDLYDLLNDCGLPVMADLL